MQGANSYRLFRLRRLILVALLAPLAVWALILALKGPAAFALLPFAVLPVLLHVLRYPNAWMETLAVSGTMAILLALTATIGPEVGLIGLAVRILGLLILGAILLLALTGLITGLIGLGPARGSTTRASRRSSLPADVLFSAITLYPGRQDEKTTCGPADAEGMFEVLLHYDFDDPLCGIAEEMVEDEPLVAVEGELGEEEATAAVPFDGTVRLWAVVVHQSDGEHHVVSVDPETRETSATITRVVPNRNGTLVTLEERGVPMPPGYRLGFWLQDFIADHLTDEVDRAEGRPPRANRSAPQGMLVSDLAAGFVSLLAGRGAVQ